MKPKGKNNSQFVSMATTCISLLSLRSIGVLFASPEVSLALYQVLALVSGLNSGTSPAYFQLTSYLLIITSLFQIFSQLRGIQYAHIIYNRRSLVCEVTRRFIYKVEQLAIFVRLSPNRRYAPIQNSCFISRLWAETFRAIVSWCIRECIQPWHKVAVC